MLVRPILEARIKATKTCRSETELAGWACRIRTGESVRELCDWKCETTAPEVGATGGGDSSAFQLPSANPRRSRFGLLHLMNVLLRALLVFRKLSAVGISSTRAARPSSGTLARWALRVHGEIISRTLSRSYREFVTLEYVTGCWDLSVDQREVSGATLVHVLGAADQQWPLLPLI